MSEQQGQSLTTAGKLISFLMVLGLVALGGYIVWTRMAPGTSLPKSGWVKQQEQSAASQAPRTATPPAAGAQAAAPAPKAESALLSEVPHLAAAGLYQPKDNTIEVELSEYPGYAGLIAANGGLAASEDSVFFKKYGVKVKITLSEEESWSALNSGRLAASATTADVLAVYGKQFNVVVPAQIGYSRGADGIVVASNINRINQLKGKTLATSQFTEAEFFIRYLAQEAGIEVNYLADLDEQPNPEKINLFFCEDAFKAGELFLADLKAGAGRLAGCVTWAPKTTEVVDESGGKARLLVTNRNLLIIADVLVVNKPFAQANPKAVEALTYGLLEGNRMVRSNPDAHLDVLLKAFNSAHKDHADDYDRAAMKKELEKVHLSNLPENQAFFSGNIATGGSFAGIYSSAVLAYGSMIRSQVDAETFVDAKYLDAIKGTGAFAAEQIGIVPMARAGSETLEQDPLLSKDIRFFFQPNSSALDMTSDFNKQNLTNIQRMLQVSPGSKVLLRGHVDNAKVAEFKKMGGDALVRQQALAAMQLSKDRATEVRKQLLDEYKVDPKRVDTLGRGWEEPAGTDSDKNRRVEVYWYTLE